MRGENVIMTRRKNVITRKRYNGITRRGDFVITELLDFAGAVTVGVIGTTPERFAGVRAFLRHPFNHGLAALRTERCVFLGALLCTMFEAFGSKCLGKPTFFSE